MAQIGTSMLHRSLTAFINEDVETAKSIPVEDDEVDALYNQIYRELMMIIIQDPNLHRTRQLAFMGGAQSRTCGRSRDQHLRTHGIHCNGRVQRDQIQR